MYPKVNRNFTRLNNDAAAEKQERLSGDVALDQRIDNLIINGDSGPEAADARVSTPKGETFPVLKDRLDASEEDVIAFQSDYSYLGAASQYSVDPSIGTSDATTLLNDYFASLKSKGLRYTIFDKPHTYKVSGTLSGAYDVILTGIAGIESATNLNGDVNYYLGVNSSKKQFSGKINRVIYNENAFKQFRTALSETRDIKVCVFGDSISTNGGDRLNVSPLTGSGTLLSPDGISNYDTYTNRLIELLTTHFPNQTFDFYDRAIGGEALSSWDDDVTFGGVTKAWIEHVQDTGPDLLIIGFGMNHDTYAKAATFAYDLKQVIDYIEANFATIPDIAILTTPRPAYIPGVSGWGDIQGQAARQAAADSARSYGSKRGCYTIDVNRISNIKRIGKDFLHPNLSKLSNYYDYISLDGGAVSIGTNQWSVQNVNEWLAVYRSLKNFSLYLQLQFDTVTADENLAIHYNWMSSILNSIIITPNASSNSNNGRIQSYTNAADSANWTSDATTMYNHASAFSLQRVRISKRDDILEISLVDGTTGIDTVVIRDKINVWNAPGAIVIMKNAGSTMTCKVLAMEVLEDKYQMFMPTLTDSEMYGAYVAGDYSKKTPYGGNGVNHPSSIGLEEVYVPALKEFVEDVVRSSSAALPYGVSGVMQKDRGVTFFGVDGHTGYYYANLTTPQPVNATGMLRNNSGTYYTRNREVKNIDDLALLGDEEFAAYVSGGVVQLLIKTSIIGDGTGYVFTGYFKI
jgi:hypothetical protein